MLPWKLWKRHIWPVNQNLSSVYISLAKFQLISCNLSRAMIWQWDTSQTFKTVFSHLNWKDHITQLFISPSTIRHMIYFIHSKSLSLTYIVLNLLLQNELESKKMESDSCVEFTKSLTLLLEMKLLKIILSNECGGSREYGEGIQLVNRLRNQLEYDEEIRMKPCQWWAAGPVA